MHTKGQLAEMYLEAKKEREAKILEIIDNFGSFHIDEEMNINSSLEDWSKLKQKIKGEEK